jgi:hypothetical protein
MQDATLEEAEEEEATFSSFRLRIALDFSRLMGLLSFCGSRCDLVQVGWW